MFETTWPLLIQALSLYFSSFRFREDFVVMLIPVEEVWYSLSLSHNIIIFADHFRFG